MLLKTHLAIAIFFILLFVEHIQNKFIFVSMVLIATALPDLDNASSEMGKYLIFKPFQFFVKHRGFVHSFTTAIVLSIIIAYFWPVASLGFFIGYSVHLISDSFTKQGIQPFWPLKTKSSGFINSGGRIEESLFFSLIFVNIILSFFVFVIN
jgi:inner membrane protein